jgi:hypothetical protein
MKGEDIMAGEVEEREYFVANQVIVTGPPAEIESLTSGAQDRLPLRLTHIKRLNPGGLFEAAADVRLPSQSNYVIDLYEVAGGPSEVIKTVTTINEFGLDKSIVAEPNFLVGDPYTGGGSPYTGGGSPYTGGGSPYTGGGSPMDSATEGAAAFRSQWALGAKDKGGIEAIASSGAPSTRYRGAGVRVGVFDSAPEPEEFKAGQAEVASNKMSLNWINPPLTMTVSYPNPCASVKPAGAVLFSDHGIFVSSLVYGVAPEADIRLFRVLDKYVQGDLATLNTALSTFITQVIADKQSSPSLKGAIINLSMGLMYIPSPVALRLGLPAPAIPHSLSRLLYTASYNGLVIVASAGNDSNLMSMQEPAERSNVIGVAASDPTRVRACFSCLGDITAPGGQVKTGDGKPGSDGAVLGMVLSTSFPTGYAWAAGTSFAAPLVSGLAALIFEKEPWLHPASVWNRIQAGAIRSPDPALGAGIIHVPGTLLEGCSPLGRFWRRNS